MKSKFRKAREKCSKTKEKCINPNLSAYFNSASCIHFSSTGFILAADFGVMSSFSKRQIADWLYAGPFVALKAWPTWVWVKPSASRRSLNALANSLISSRLTPSTVVAWWVTWVCRPLVKVLLWELGMLAIVGPSSMLVSDLSSSSLKKYG